MYRKSLFLNVLNGKYAYFNKYIQLSIIFKEFKYLFLRIYRYLIRLTSIKIILLIDDDSLSYRCI